jgi:antibiotic biosynthesis monooxygenase (ABM) superfamily enzyme
VEHEGRPLAADEFDGAHRHPPGLASVHVRAIVTWVSIFPLVVLGMSILSVVAESWPLALRALVLTLVVVPTAVYVVVPNLLLAYMRLIGRIHRARRPGSTPHRTEAP